eukprot:7049165-Heterocapsa_arctica.AAC.1
MDGHEGTREIQGQECDGEDRQALLWTDKTATGIHFMAEQDGGGQDDEKRDHGVRQSTQFNRRIPRQD